MAPLEIARRAISPAVRSRLIARGNLYPPFLSTKLAPSFPPDCRMQSSSLCSGRGGHREGGRVVTCSPSRLSNPGKERLMEIAPHHDPARRRTLVGEFRGVGDDCGVMAGAGYALPTSVAPCPRWITGRGAEKRYRFARRFPGFRLGPRVQRRRGPVQHPRPARPPCLPAATARCACSSRGPEGTKPRHAGWHEGRRHPGQGANPCTISQSSWPPRW